MKKEFSAEFLLATLLGNKDCVSWRDLDNAKNVLYGFFKEDTYVCSDWRAVFGAIVGSFDVLSFRDSYFRRTTGCDSKFFERDFVIRHLGRDLGLEVAERAYDLISVN